MTHADEPEPRDCKLSENGQSVLPAIDSTCNHRSIQTNIIRFSIITVFGVAYWFVYAFSNDMFFYYRSSVYPLLAATNTPNPFVFIHAGSLINLYESGIEWFPTGHFGFIFLLGETFFSVLLTVLVVKNLMFACGAIMNGILHEDFIFGKFFSTGIIVLTVAICLFPLDALAVIILSTHFSITFLEMWVFNYSYIENTIDAFLLILLILLWRRLIQTVSPSGNLAAHYSKQ